MNQEDLLYAVQVGDYEQAKEALEKGLDPNFEKDYSLVDWAAQEGHTDIIKLLVRFGANVEGGAEENTPLNNAAGSGNLQVVEALLNCGADIENHRANSGTALSNAAVWGHCEIIDLLIARGANVNAFDSEGVTALGMLTSPRQEEVRQQLRAYNGRKRVIDSENLPQFINIANMVINLYEELGYSSLNDVEKVLVCVLIARMEINKFGFDSILQILPEKVQENVVESLKRIGAIRSAKLIQTALEIARKIARRDQPNSVSTKALLDKLGKSDAAFFDDEDKLLDLIERYIEENRAQLPTVYAR